MLKDFPEAEFGPRIEFREYSFLQNPLVPKQVILAIRPILLCLRIYFTFLFFVLGQCNKFISSLDLGEGVIARSPAL